MKAETYKKRIIKDMKAVGTYRDEFKETITTLARIYEDMDVAREKFEKSGGNIIIKHTNKNGSTNLVKNPLYKAIEDKENLVLAFNRELGLTPRGLKQLKTKGLEGNKASPLAAALSGMQ